MEKSIWVQVPSRPPTQNLYNSGSKTKLNGDLLLQITIFYGDLIAWKNCLCYYDIMKNKRFLGRGFNNRIKIFAVITVLLTAGAGAFYFFIYNKPETAFEREVKKMATDYYENYYYARIEKQFPAEEVKNKLQIQVENGIRPVTLRQLVLLNGGKNLDFRKKVEGRGYKCDEETSSIILTPKKPFGKKDYDVKVSLICNKK